jgi:hypothetical protein
MTLEELTKTGLPEVVTTLFYEILEEFLQNNKNIYRELERKLMYK